MAYSQSRLRGRLSYRQTFPGHITQSVVLMVYGNKQIFCGEHEGLFAGKSDRRTAAPTGYRGDHTFCGWNTPNVGAGLLAKASALALLTSANKRIFRRNPVPVFCAHSCPP